MTKTMGECLQILHEDRLDRGGFWEKTTLRRYINEGVNEVARTTECCVADTTIAMVAGTQDYTAPAMAVRILPELYISITGSTQRYPLEPVDYSVASQHWNINQAISSRMPEMWTTTGYPPTLTIKLWPKPNTAGTIYVHYAKFPTPIASTGASDATTIDLPNNWEDIAIDYAEWRAWCARGDAQRAQIARQVFDAKNLALAEAAVRWVDTPGEIVFDQYWWVNGPM